jgi:hypothetical protein
LHIVDDCSFCAAITLSLFDMHKVAWRKALGGIDHRLTVRAPGSTRLGLLAFISPASQLSGLIVMSRQDERFDGCLSSSQGHLPTLCA